MGILTRLIAEAARRAAEDPEIRSKAIGVAEEAARRARPKLENAGRHIMDSTRETSAEGSFTDDPLGYAQRLKRRLLPPEQS